MKKIFVLLALAALPAFADNGYTGTGSNFNANFVGTVGGGAAQASFVRTCTITSAAAGTAVHCLADADVGATQSAYLGHFHAKVNGATAWATTATCSLQDTAGSPVSLVSMAVAALTANAFVGPFTANVTASSAYALGSGTTAGKGIDVKCDANGTGSNLVVTLFGVIK